jgi:PH (Pleckstrin Homology) domain-containing protein
MNYGFQLDPGENIIRVVHRSFIDLVAPVVMSLFLILVAIALAYLEGRNPATVPFPELLVLILVILMSIIGGLILLIGIYTYRRNVLIFTNFHLVEVEQPSLFSRQVSQLTYARVQDVSGQRVGFWATIFDYGNVQIQSAGEQEKFIFRRAPHPERLSEEALETRDACLRAMGAAAPGAMPIPAAPASEPPPTVGP